MVREGNIGSIEMTPKLKFMIECQLKATMSGIKSFEEYRGEHREQMTEHWFATDRLFWDWIHGTGRFAPKPYVEPEPFVLPPEIVELARRRQEARREKDWVLADSIRTILADRGYKLRDTLHDTAVERI